jgi:hypothetical protein
MAADLVSDPAPRLAADVTLENEMQQLAADRPVFLSSLPPLSLLLPDRRAAN